MAGVVGRYGRKVGGGLLLAVVVLAPVAAHLGWVEVAERVYSRSVSPGKDDGRDDESSEESWDETEARYLAKDRPERTGSTLVRIAPGTGSTAGQWMATARHTAALSPDDPMVKDLRSDTQDLYTWVPFDLALGRDADDCSYRGFGFNPDDDRLEQQPKSPVYATTVLSELSWRGTAYDCVNGHTVITLVCPGDWLGEHGIYDSWTVTIDTRDRAILALRGATTLSQTTHRVKLLLPTDDAQVTIELGDPDTPNGGDPNDAVVLAQLLQRPPSPGWEAFWLALAVTAVTGWWVVPFARSWAPPATRRRWIAVATAGCAVTGLLLLYALAGRGYPPWSEWQYPGRGSLLAVWWWALLPFLLAAFTVRAGEGRAPRVGELFPLVVPSVGLLLPVVVLAVTGRTALPFAAVVLAAVAATGAWWTVDRGVWRLAGRRWAATAAVGAWVTVMAAGPGTGLPVTGVHLPFGSWPLVNSLGLAALGGGWLAVPWTVMAAHEHRRWRTLAAGVVLWGIAIQKAVSEQWEYSWSPADESGRSWASVGLYSGFAANQPLAFIAILVVAVMYLRSSSGDGHWPPHARTTVLGLGIGAVGTGLALYGFVVIGTTSRSGYYLALAIAVGGFSWLLPSAAEDRAVRLHDVRPRVHNRLVHALLKDQALAAGRREFFTASRAALAVGDLTRPEWNARWHGLGALGARGTAPQRSVALRLTALGTSGGRGATRNGAAGAVMLTLLSLPWAAYTVLPLLGETQDLSYIEAWSYGLRWSLYGWIYGYAYSWLRGGSPVGKALCLLAVVLPAELAQLLYQGLEPRDFGISLLLTAGDCLAVFLVLGLYWEARLVRAAGLRWGQIRNFRSLSATAVPATTVLVAAATALATAMVGVWITPDNGPAPTTPGGEASVSSTPTPGAP